MGHFTVREVLIGVAIVVWLGALFVFLNSEKAISDIAANLLTDIAFAVFLALYIERVNERERLQANKARQRSVGLAVQKYHQNIHGLMTALIDDGIKTSKASSLPTLELLREHAIKFNGTTVPTGDAMHNPLPYCAYFLCFYVGNTKAHVYPPRSASQYIIDLSQRTEQLYEYVFLIDNGLLPDNVVEALTLLKNQSLITMCRLGNVVPFRVGYWAEKDLEEISDTLEVLRRYYCPIIGYSISTSSNVFYDLLRSGLSKAVAK